jgi:hypothetical protein
MASSSRSFRLSLNNWSTRTKATYKIESATPHLHRQLTLANVQVAALGGILGTQRSCYLHLPMALWQQLELITGSTRLSGENASGSSVASPGPAR